MINLAKILKRGIKFGNLPNSGITHDSMGTKKPYLNLIDNTINLNSFKKENVFINNELILEGKYSAKNIEEYFEFIKNSRETNSSIEKRKEFLFAGESNVGKSSLINCLF